MQSNSAAGLRADRLTPTNVKLLHCSFTVVDEILQEYEHNDRMPPTSIHVPRLWSSCSNDVSWREIYIDTCQFKFTNKIRTYPVLSSSHVFTRILTI